MTIDLSKPQLIAARALLVGYQHPTVVARANPEEIRQALLTLLPSIDYVMLGICADNWAEGILALTQYCQALDLPLLLPTPALTGAIYIKFNPRLPKCYASAYLGIDRGVLIAAQSDDPNGLNDMFGHLPLDLFAG
jgi:hypothetical protein